MTNEIPNYLRLHIEEASEAAPLSAESTDGLVRFCHSFEQATGWRLTLDETPSLQASQTGPTSDVETSPQLESTLPDDGPGLACDPPIELPRARRLASAFSELVQQLQRTRTELQRREAELAAGVPVRRRRNEEKHLALRLESVLKGGAEAVGCHAAALFSLDDATTQLKLRASWGLPVDRMMQPPRPLRGAVADLEALIGHAVVLEDTSLLPHWRVPEDFASAVCVPVSSPTEPLGTLWMFCDHVRPFSDEQTNLVEIIAGRVASELQREVLLKECVSSKQVEKQLALAADWQQARLPNVKPLLDDWELAGTTHHSQILGASFYDWSIPRDGSLAVSVGMGDGSMLESALTTASLQSLLRAHSEHVYDPAKLLTLINESLCQASAGGQSASLFYASIGPDNGDLSCTAAGKVQAHLINASGARKLLTPASPIGVDMELPIELGSDRVSSGEVLVAVSPGVANGAETLPEDIPYLNAVRRLIDRSPEDLIAAVRASLLAEVGDRRGTDWSIVIAKRR